MKPAPFEYLAASSVAEAIEYLAEHGSDARVLAGGQSLVRLMNTRLALPKVIIDINGVTDLDRITTEEPAVIIGALTRQRTAELSDVVMHHVPLLSEAGKNVAHVSVRERGTVVGSVAFADPSAELPVALLALDGQVVAEGPEGQRTIDADDFFTGPWLNALSDVELATEIRIPYLAKERTGSAFLEIARRHGELPVCGVATVVTLAEDRTVGDIRIALCAVDQRPVRARQAEGHLFAQQPTPDLVDETAEAAAEGLNPIPDCHGSADFRRHLARILTRRSLQSALSRAGKESPHA